MRLKQERLKDVRNEGRFRSKHFKKKLDPLIYIFCSSVVNWIKEHRK